MRAKPMSAADKTEMRERPAYAPPAAAAEPAWKRTMESFDQRLRK
jgi:hypothetical protein